MKKNLMKDINKNMEEFDIFLNDENTELICNIVALGLAVSSAVMVMIGQISKNKVEENKEEK